MKRAWCGAMVALAATAAGGQAQSGRPAEVPLPNWVRSAVAKDDGTVIQSAPAEGASRRGTVKRGTRLSVEERVRAPGCPQDRWLRLQSSAYVCEAHVEFSRLSPMGANLAWPLPGSVLPLTYGVVQVDGSRRFAHPSDYEADQFLDTLGKSFTVVTIGRESYGGVSFHRTRGGHWILSDVLSEPEPSTFVGVTLRQRSLPLAWVIVPSARVYAAPGRSPGTGRQPYREVLSLRPESGSGEWVTLLDGGRMRARDLRVATASPRPSGVGPEERWVDVNLSQQTLVAYEGDRPVYATLISSGRPRKDLRTPTGEFRLWVKLAHQDMDDLEREDVESNYAVEGVPWVQFFKGAYGFHAAFWHDDFGQPRSHGCINLSPRDARWLFDFTAPTLPRGWYAILPVEEDPGTLVRIREP
ncbi:MAG: L,D-transpeptidase [Myxococcales bacterium]|nr:L,D-transpeptidase [Myxococcales bacterium]